MAAWRHRPFVFEYDAAQEGVVLEVLTHALKIHHGRDAERAKIIGISTPESNQEFGAAKAAGSDDHFARAVKLTRHAVVKGANAGAPGAF